MEIEQIQKANHIQSADSRPSLKKLLQKDPVCQNINRHMVKEEEDKTSPHEQCSFLFFKQTT